MRSCRRWILMLTLAASSATCFAQEADSLFLSEVEDELTFEDSLDIFNMIDSILAIWKSGQVTVSGKTQLQ